MIYKLSNVNGLTSEDIIDRIDKGYSFRVFRYQIALVAVTFFRLSPAFFVKDEEEARELSKKFNIRSWLFGLWFIHTGPINVMRSVRLNNGDGINVTKDILLNLDTYNRAENTVQIKKVYTLFDKLDDRTDFKELTKALNAFRNQNHSVKNVYVGRYLNVEENIIPPIVIAMDTDGDKALIENTHLQAFS